MVEHKDKDQLKKGRLTLTGNKMPDEVYKKLEEKGSDRKLTPYIVGLVEKEEMMDKLIESLSILVEKVDNIDVKFSNLEAKLDGVSITAITDNISNEKEEEIKQGDLNITDKIIGGIDEDVDGYDF